MLAVVGLAMGSFINALVWRVRHKRDFVKERSECTHCHHTLAWYDLIPVISWLSLRGKCRYCHKKIDDSPLIEVLTAGLFVVSYLSWPYDIASAVSISVFVLWLLCLVLLIALAVYDSKWYLLPDKLVWPLVGLGTLTGLGRWIMREQARIFESLGPMASGVLIIAGVYFALYMLSKGRWVGFGDVKLSIFIGLVLGWQQSLLVLFLANIIGLLWVMPSLIVKKATVASKIPFGPFLIAATIISFLWGDRIIQWYINTVIGL